MKISHKHYEPTQAVTTRVVVANRTEIQGILKDLVQDVPTEKIASAPFCIYNFMTSEVDGYDVTLGVPVSESIEHKRFKTEWFPELEVLSTVHRREPGMSGETMGALFAYADKYGLISDEFYREVFLDESHPGGPGVEVQFVIHNWNAKLGAGLERVLGVEARGAIMQGSERLEIESGLEERFQWIKGMLDRLNGAASEDQKYDILSGCAHVFPQSQVDKLTKVFSESRELNEDPLAAVDAVIDFMNGDPGWAEGGRRDGYTIYAKKQPRDRKAHAEAKTDLERRQAYCFCPILRTKIDQGMPVDYCYCGSGWFRQQWEGAVGKPVKIDIIRSVLRGDDACEFAIHLPRNI